MPVSRPGGSFWRVNISTYEQNAYSPFCPIIAQSTIDIRLISMWDYCRWQQEDLMIQNCLSHIFAVTECRVSYGCCKIHQYLTLADLHRRVFVVRRGACGQLYGCDPKTPDVCFEVVTFHLWTNSGRFVKRERCVHMPAVPGNFFK